MLQSTYADDILIDADNIDQAKQRRDVLIRLLHAGGFPLREWISNHPDLTNDLREEDRLRRLWKDFGSDQPVKTLGIAWDPAADEFRCRILDAQNAVGTERSVLSVIARLCDPLGWLSPVMICAKILCRIRGVAELAGTNSCRLWSSRGGGCLLRLSQKHPPYKYLNGCPLPRKSASHSTGSLMPVGLHAL